MNNPNLMDDPEQILKMALSTPFYEYDQKDDRWIDIATFEPDSNHTPRVTAYLASGMAALSVIYCREGKRRESSNTFELVPGRGHIVTTYAGGNESPLLLPFASSPLEVRISSDDPKVIARGLYDAIHGGEKPDDNYRVAAAAMMMNEVGEIKPAIFNRTEEGS
jgi:hypothetical protein